MQALLGIDIGTTGAKAAVFDECGQVVAVGHSTYAVYYPQPGWAEQDPAQVWQGVVSAVRQAVSQMPAPASVKAVGISSQGAVTILLGEDDRPLCPAISWMDMRAAPLTREIREALGEEQLYRSTGWPFDAWMPLAHVAWLRRIRPEQLAHASLICSIDAFIKLQLCGRAMTDPTLAGATGFYDIEDREWKHEHLDYVGLDLGQLPATAPSTAVVGGLTAGAAEVLGLPTGTPVINGAHDQICSVTAAGLSSPGQMLVGTGTAWVIAGATDRPVYDLAHQLTVEPHTIPGLWCPLRTQGGVGTALEWLVASALGGLARDRDRGTLFDGFDQAVQGAPAGAHGLVCLAPERRHGAAGHLIGFTAAHTVGDVGRAFLEGVACDLAIMAREMRAAGVTFASLLMTGGATRSPAWPAIVADVLGLPIHIPQMVEAGARGAALLAGTGSGLFARVTSAVAAFGLPGRDIVPNPATRGLYDELLARHERYDDLLSEPLAHSGLASEAT